MTAYTGREEHLVRLQARVKEWSRSGLLGDEQAARLLEMLRVDLRRTGPVLRGVLAGFTALVIAALVGLTVVAGDVDSEIGIAAVMALFAGLCLWAADHLVSAYRLYRHGVEETCAAAVVVLAGVSAGAAASRLSNSGLPLAIAFAVASAAGWFVYRRYGHLAAALMGMICLAAVPFPVALSVPVERALSCAALSVVGRRAALVRKRSGDDYPGDSAGLIRAAAWAGVYLLVNLHLTGNFSGYQARIGLWRGFWWGTFGAVWLLPFAAVWSAVRQRDRYLLRVGLGMLLATLVSHKPYLGWARQPWDPMLLGVLLTAGVVVVRRWLASGEGGERAGFTPRRILAADAETIGAVGVLSATFQPQAPVAPDGGRTTFGDGRSGGAGASGTF